MKLRCPACRVILRVKSAEVGNRKMANCPRCSAVVSLAHDRFESSPSTPDSRVKVRCQACGTHLRALASFIGTRSRCPKCREEVLIERTSTAALSADAGGGGGSTGGSVGIDTMAMQKPPLPPSDMDLDEFLDKPSAPRASVASSPPGGATGGLLNAPIGALTEAAQGIRESAETLGHISPGQRDDFDQEKADDESFDYEEESVATETRAEVEVGLKPGPAVLHQPEDDELETGSEEAGYPAEVHAVAGKKRFSAGAGFLSGALSGLVVGGGWFGALTFGGAAVESFMAPLPTWTMSWGVPFGVLVVAFPAFLGALVGLMATVGSSKRGNSGPGFVRCIAWGLLGGLVMASMTITQPGGAFNQVAFSSALNWIRDFVLIGMLIPALARLFGPGAS